MSDKLSLLLQEVSTQKSTKSDDPNQRIIDALKKALKATTPTHAGTPWDNEEDKIPSIEYCLRESE